MGRLDDAYAACTRALDRAYGVPKLRLYLDCGGVLEKKNDKPAAKKIYEDGVAFGQTLPEKAAQPTTQALQRAIGKL
jgi:hypothetical protein